MGLSMWSTVAWIRLWARQAYPLHFSCKALELRPAKFCHPVKNTAANLCFSLLIVKMSRFDFGSDHSVPSTDLGLRVGLEKRSMIAIS